MKINIKTDLFSASAFSVALIVALSFSSGIAYAATCTPPIPPVCYQNVPIYQNTGPQSDGSIVSPDGQWIIPASGASNAVPNSEYIQVDCTDDPTYQGELLTYNECVQMNSMNQSSADLQSSLDNTASQTDTSAPSGAQVCPYPVQPASQASQAVIDTVDGDGGTVKKYADGTYALFDVLGRYEFSSSENEFNIFTKAEKDQTAILEIGLGTYPQQPADSSSLMEQFQMDLDSQESSIHQIQSSINSWLADSSNCPNTKPQTQTNTTSPAPSPVTIMDSANGTVLCQQEHGAHSHSLQYIGPAYSCGCDDGYTIDANAQCVTAAQAFAERTGYTPASNADASGSTAPAPTDTPGGGFSAAFGNGTDTPSINVALQRQADYTPHPPAPTPKQKHWYDWLNPINWFSWIH